MNRFGLFVFPAAMLVGLLLSSLIIVTALQTAPSATNAGSALDTTAAAQSVDPVAHGRELFIAKGCIVCHANNRVMAAREGMMDFSDVPNLTTVRLDRDYLRRWLQNPAAVKPTTQMPNLNLSDGEIDALAAFLLDSGR